jgi:hypothetical protein
MSFARTAAATAAMLVLWCATAGAGGPLRPFRHGFWSGGAYTDDRTGGFTHCSAGVAYDSGINLFVLVTGGYRWWLGFINPKWSLTPNARTAITLQLDDGAPFSGLASIPSGQLLLVSLPNTSKLLAAFRRSSRLALDAEGQSFSFKLNGTPAVMDQLASCVSTSIALTGQATPTAAAATPAVQKSAADAETAPISPAPTAATADHASPAAGASRADAAAPPPPPGPAAAPNPGTAEIAAAPQTGATAAAEPAPSPDQAGKSATAPLPGIGAQPASQGAEKPPATTEPGSADAAAPPLAFTSVAPATPSPPSAPTAPMMPSGPATAVEEIRLATDFFTRARLPDARLIDADKPPALAAFTAVWRSADAAGAVKIIPPGSDTSGIEIASNLIAVDPQLCKGDFSAARFRSDIANSVVFSAVLSCNEANEQRVTEYFVTPRHQGGFIVFAVIRSKAAGRTPEFDFEKIDVLSRAAIHAAEGQG